MKPGKAITVAAADVYGVDQGAETLCATALITMRNIDLGSAGSTPAVAATGHDMGDTDA